MLEGIITNITDTIVGALIAVFVLLVVRKLLVLELNVHIGDSDHGESEESEGSERGSVESETAPEANSRGTGKPRQQRSED